MLCFFRRNHFIYIYICIYIHIYIYIYIKYLGITISADMKVTEQCGTAASKFRRMHLGWSTPEHLMDV